MRFVRVMPSEDPKLAGERLRIEREAPGELCDLVDETVWPEQVANVNAHRRKKITTRLILTEAQQIWLRDCLIEMHGAPLSEQERCHLLSIRAVLRERNEANHGELWRAEIATLDLLLGGVAS